MAVMHSTAKVNINNKTKIEKMKTTIKILLFFPCVIADIITLPLQLILTKLNDDFCPYPFCQYLFES